MNISEYNLQEGCVIDASAFSANDLDRAIVFFATTHFGFIPEIDGLELDVDMWEWESDAACDWMNANIGENFLLSVRDNSLYLDRHYQESEGDE